MTSRDSRIIIYEQPSVRHRGGRRQEASSFILNILNIFTFEQTRRRCFCLYLKLYTHTHTHTVLPHLSIPTRSVHTYTQRDTEDYVRTYLLTPVWSMRELTSIRRVDNGVFIGVCESMVRRYCTVRHCDRR